MTVAQKTGTESVVEAEEKEKISPVRKRSASLEIALTETGLVLGTMIGNVIAEKVAKGTQYNILITFAGGFIGASAGRGLVELYYTAQNYFRKQD